MSNCYISHGQADACKAARKAISPTPLKKKAPKYSMQQSWTRKNMLNNKTHGQSWNVIFEKLQITSNEQRQQQPLEENMVHTAYAMSSGVRIDNAGTL